MGRWGFSLSLHIDSHNGHIMHGVHSLPLNITGYLVKVAIHVWLSPGSWQLVGWTAIFERQALDRWILAAAQCDVLLHILRL